MYNMVVPWCVGSGGSSAARRCRRRACSARAATRRSRARRTAPSAPPPRADRRCTLSPPLGKQFTSNTFYQITHCEIQEPHHTRELRALKEKPTRNEYVTGTT